MLWNLHNMVKHEIDRVVTIAGKNLPIWYYTVINPIEHRTFLCTIKAQQLYPKKQEGIFFNRRKTSASKEPITHLIVMYSTYGA